MKLGKGKLASIAVVGILLLVAVSYGILKYQESISNTVTITGYEIQMWRKDTNARVTTISWGSLDQGSNKTSDVALGFTQKLTMKNVGDYAIRAAWKLNSTLPNGATLTAQYALSEGSPWDNWPESDYGQLGSMSPGEVNSRRIQFTLIIPDGTPRGPLTFEILLLASNT
jgi:hypothetical protein